MNKAQEKQYELDRQKIAASRALVNSIVAKFPPNPAEAAWYLTKKGK